MTINFLMNGIEPYKGSFFFAIKTITYMETIDLCLKGDTYEQRRT